MSKEISSMKLRNVLADIVANISGSVFVVNPSTEITRHLISVLSDTNDHPEFQLLATEGTLKTVRNDFLKATHAADLVKQGVLSMRSFDGEPVNSLFITDLEAKTIITAGENSIDIGTDDQDFVSKANKYYADLWETAIEFDLRTPALSEVKETIGEEVGQGVEGDLTEALGILEERDEEFDIVELCILLAAKNHALLYDLGKWGEDSGVASTATFSRTKTSLENQGYIGTEKVPIEVGRPRMRLMLGGEFSEQPGITDLVDVLD